MRTRTNKRDTGPLDVDGSPKTAPPATLPALPELLAPAGDWDCARAAVENGADAIYFGLDRFNARMRADNFTRTDLPKLMSFLHRRGVKGYVAFNILVFADELAEAERFLHLIIDSGVDAALVQDIGLCRLIRRLSPDFPIHASTQMTITSAAGVAFARQLGCNRVILARECSIADIEKIRNALRQTGTVPKPEAPLATQESPWPAHPHLNMELPLETFVHGALCVAYSGQCLTSEALGGRSANRGECAQACRMPYELIADGQPVPLGDRRYLLSPQDLAGLDVLPDLVRAGVASLKIEGRLKTAEYVANITRIYRQALDTLASRPLDPRPFRYDMEMAFSRGLCTGWLRGTNNQKLVHAWFGKKRGVYLGQVSRVEASRVYLHLEGPLKPGDGVVFDGGRPDEKEEGGRVCSLQPAPSRTHKSAPKQRPSSNVTEVVLTFRHGDVNFRRIQPGNRLWKTSDPALDRRLRQTFSGHTPRFQRPIDLEVHGQVGQPMTLIARDEQGHLVQRTSCVALDRADKTPLTTERLGQQLGRLGGTPFRLGQLHNRLIGPVILPLSELNRLRRETVQELEQVRAQPLRWTLLDSGTETDQAEHPPDPGESGIPPGASSPPAQLIVLVRTMSQLQAALDAGIRVIYCELEDLKKYRDAVRLVREFQPKPEIFVAPPRISKPGEEWILRQVQSCDPDGFLVRNYDHLTFFSASRSIGDFSLNVANPLTAEYFLRRYRLERLTASYDLNIRQLEALLRAAPPSWFEVTIHQHMPMFHMEHCLFCAFLSKGTDYTNCGRPCDTRELKLRDRVGAAHVLKADAGCRNTVFNARAQTGAEYLASLLALGLRHFRIEFLTDSPQQVATTITHYRALLRGETTGAALWRTLKLHHQLGVTRGPMEPD
jgi:putative protease